MTFTTSHDHEDQRWMHARYWRTSSAYHACPADFHKHFTFTFFLLPAFSSGYSAFNWHLFSHSDTKRLVLPWLAECFPCMILNEQVGRAGILARRKCSTAKYTTNRSSISAKEFFGTGFWRLPSRGKIYPKGPICPCLSFSFLASLTSLIIIYTKYDLRAISFLRQYQLAIANSLI